MIHQISLMMIVRKRRLAEKLVFLCEYKSRLAIGGPFASHSVIQNSSRPQRTQHMRVLYTITFGQSFAPPHKSQCMHIYTPKSWGV